MAVIGNFIGVGGKNDVRPEPALAMREAEASFQAIVDPYARADFLHRVLARKAWSSKKATSRFPRCLAAS